VTTSEGSSPDTVDADGGDVVVQAPAPDAGGDQQAALANRENEWIDLLADGTALDQRRDLFDAAFSALDSMVKVDHQASDTIGRVIKTRLADVPAEVSLAEMTEALKIYLGVDGAYLVHWLAYADTVDRLAQVEAVASAEVANFLRRLLSENGARIDLVQRAALLGPDDWIQVFKNAYEDLLTGRLMFSLAVVKLDGSTLRLELAADSLLRLTTHLLELVNSVPAATVFGPSPLDVFVHTLAQTAQLVAPDEGDGPGDDSLRGASRLEQTLE
jgi:hypothetical protein